MKNNKKQKANKTKLMTTIFEEARSFAILSSKKVAGESKGR